MHPCYIRLVPLLQSVLSLCLRHCAHKLNGEVLYTESCSSCWLDHHRRDNHHARGSWVGLNTSMDVLRIGNSCILFCISHQLERYSTAEQRGSCICSPSKKFDWSVELHGSCLVQGMHDAEHELHVYTMARTCEKCFSIIGIQMCLESTQVSKWRHGNQL